MDVVTRQLHDARETIHTHADDAATGRQWQGAAIGWRDFNIPRDGNSPSFEYRRTVLQDIAATTETCPFGSFRRSRIMMRNAKPGCSLGVRITNACIGRA